MIKNFAFVSIIASNPKQASYYFTQAFGFKILGYRGLETGDRKFSSYLLSNGNIKIIITGAISPDSELSKYVQVHGDGVNSIGLLVDDNDASEAELLSGSVYELPYSNFCSYVSLGTELTLALLSPESLISLIASFKTIQSKQQPHLFETYPKYENIDHIVINCPFRTSSKVLSVLSKLEFKLEQTFDPYTVKTAKSSLMSCVMSDTGHVVRIAINEPPSENSNSQIQEYLDYHGGMGVQHMAFSCTNLHEIVEKLILRGVLFLDTRDSGDGTNPTVEDIILHDREGGGELFQCFTELIQDRPTLFIELIERRGATGFGKGNFNKLFRAVEKAQILRGNLK